jgi:hypothetical protein
VGEENDDDDDEAAAAAAVGAETYEYEDDDFEEPSEDGAAASGGSSCAGAGEGDVGGGSSSSSSSSSDGGGGEAEEGSRWFGDGVSAAPNAPGPPYPAQCPHVDISGLTLDGTASAAEVQRAVEADAMRRVSRAMHPQAGGRLAEPAARERRQRRQQQYEEYAAAAGMGERAPSAPSWDGRLSSVERALGAGAVSAHHGEEQQQQQQQQQHQIAGPDRWGAGVDDGFARATAEAAALVSQVDIEWQLRGARLGDSLGSPAVAALGATPSHGASNAARGSSGASGSMWLESLHGGSADALAAAADASPHRAETFGDSSPLVDLLMRLPDSPTEADGTLFGEMLSSRARALHFD